MSWSGYAALSAALGGLFVFGAVQAQVGPASAPSLLPPGAERPLVERMCTSCHGLDWAANHRDTPQGWAAVVESMVVRGAIGTEPEVNQVIAYLSRSFPTAGSAAVAAAAPPPAASAPATVYPELKGAVAASPAGSPSRRPGADWAAIGRDPGGQRFSPLTQITAENASKLKLAWSYKMRREGEGDAQPRNRLTQLTPLVIDGVMFFTTPYGRAVAVEADSGKEIWSRNLPTAWGRPGVRSLAYRPADGVIGSALYLGMTNGYLVGLDARTGAPLAGFGQGGAVNIKSDMVKAFPNANYNLTSPPVIYKDVIITGSQVQERPALGASGDIRAWDARTGKALWSFHTIPRPGEPNHETWPGDTWKDRSGANAWGLLTVDDKTGTVFVPLGTVTFDYYGGDRPGANLYGDTLVALDARTGARKWHYQVVHHDIWDYDLTAPPMLVDVNVGGRKIPAVAQVTKQSLLFVLDRATGKPIHAVEERPVPQTGFAPGEHPWPTQPHPVITPALARNDFKRSEIARITPEHTAFCEKMLNTGSTEPAFPAGPGGLRSGPTYSSFDAQGTIMFPGTLGGVNYQGLSYDPQLNYAFAATMSVGEVFQATPDPDPTQPPPVQRYHFWDADKKWPCNAGPWGELVAVDLNTGKIAWRRPFGHMAEIEKLGFKDMGAPVIGGTISTAGRVTFAGGTLDNRFSAVDSRTGKELWSVDVGAASHNLPLTYLGRDGRQYVAVIVSGGGFLRDPVIPPVLLAYALPDQGAAKPR